MSENIFDLCVIGAGPGGYVAAIEAARLGLKTVVVERGHLGGTCLNIGCIPTKTLIAAAEVYAKVKHAADFGVKISGAVSPDWAAMLERKQGVVEKLRGGIAALLKANGVSVMNGSASFQDRRNILVTDDKGGKSAVNAVRTIIASGSAPLVPGFVPKGKRVLTSTELLEIAEIPKRLLVLGGGVIGCEFACMFATLGSKVTVVEMLDSVIPNMDREATRVLTREMRANGVEIMTGKPLENIKAGVSKVSGEVGGTKVEADYLLVSVGRRPSVEGLNLAAAGIAADERGWISVDGRCRTSAPGIYAIGDVTGTRWQLAHFASAQGILVAGNIASGESRPFEDDLVPGCVFTTPEIASIGKTSEECAAAGINTKTGKFPFAALGKAMAIGETEGFCKIIADAATDQILGVHIVGPHATDLISEAVAAMRVEMSAEELGRAIHAHPTLGEVMMEAAHAVHGASVHQAPTRKRQG